MLCAWIVGGGVEILMEALECKRMQFPVSMVSGSHRRCSSRHHFDTSLTLKQHDIRALRFRGVTRPTRACDEQEKSYRMETVCTKRDPGNA